MTYRRTPGLRVDFTNSQFQAALQLAQAGDAVAQGFVVQATIPMIKNLTRDDDEVSVLILAVYDAIPKARTERWGGFIQAVLRTRLMNHRRGERRYNRRVQPGWEER